MRVAPSAREKGLAKVGNARVRRGMLQLAWRFLRFQAESSLARWFRARTVDGRGATRKSMIVAMPEASPEATIMLLRVAPGASTVRVPNQRARLLSAWNQRKRQASWSMPRGTRALPTLASPLPALGAALIVLR